MEPWVHSFLLALAGGLLIGAAAGLFMLSNGRVAGISGIAGELVGRWPARWRRDLAFLAGLPLGLLLWQGISGGAVVIHLTPSNLLLAAAGILVGVGTRLANGCTSGHAVCGLARLSPRSLVATLVFMAAAIGVVLLRRILG
jgi:hypothetical protein